MLMSGIGTSWLLLGALAVITIYWLWTKSRRSYDNLNIPPFPVRPWPIFGHFFHLIGNLRDHTKRWRKTGGDIYSLDIGGDLHILINKFNDIKEIWVKHADKIVNTQVSVGDEILHEHNTGIFSARDDNWKEQRTTSLFILRSFGMGRNIMAEKIQDEVSVTLEKLAALKGQPQDVRILINISVSNIICSVAIGKRFDHEDPFFVSLIANVGIMAKYFNFVGMLTPFKQIRYLPGDIFNINKWAKATLEINEKFSKAFVSKIKQNVNENEEQDNFVGAYIQKIKKTIGKNSNSNLNEANLITIVRTLLLGGTETTSTTILWCLLYMLHYPEVQEKVFREIEKNVGTSRVPSMADKPKLTYLNAVIMETQRMASLVPIAQRREVSSTFEFGGFTFPKGSLLWLILDSVHFDKEIWGDPENFRPERFIDTTGELINREELIPFSIGRRVCLGAALARMELFLFLSAMFQSFKFEPADKSGELPTLKESFGSTVVPQPFTMKFVERKS